MTRFVYQSWYDGTKAGCDRCSRYSTLKNRLLSHSCNNLWHWLIQTGLIITKHILFLFTLFLCCTHQTSINLTGISFAFGIRLEGFSWSVSLPSLSIIQSLTGRSNINTVGHTCYKSIRNRLTLACLLDPERTPWAEQQLASVGFPTASAYLTNVFFILCIPHQRLPVKPLGTHDKCTHKGLWAVCGQQVMIKSPLNQC